MKRLVEVRSYKLKAGTAAAFDALMGQAAVPMLRRWGTQVVTFGPSAHEADTYFLVRAYDDLADLTARQDAFYGSDEWRDGPRTAILAHIDSYLSSVMRMSSAAIEDLRQSNPAAV